jgi:hypothetical protein
VEAFDAGGKISLRQLFRSKIFKLFTLPYIQAAIVLPLAYFVLTRLPIAGSVDAAVYVLIILMGAAFGGFIGLYWFMRHSVSLTVDWKSISKYVLAALLMAGVLLLLPATTTLLTTIGKAIAGFGIYVVILVAVDKQARQLIGLVWAEIKATMQQLTSRGNNGNFSGEDIPKQAT